MNTQIALSVALLVVGLLLIAGPGLVLVALGLAVLVGPRRITTWLGRLTR